jgi:hypothetical protein
VVGCTDGSGEAWRREGSQARGSVEVPIRGTHRGRRSWLTANEAGHMTASNPPQKTLNITLASRGPSTHAPLGLGLGRVRQPLPDQVHLVVVQTGPPAHLARVIPELKL